MTPAWHHTTICAVRREGLTAVACDGQVTFGTTVLKHGASKLRRLGGGRVVAGFAGSVADALALFTRFEAKLEEFAGNLERAAVELADLALGQEPVLGRHLVSESGIHDVASFRNLLPRDDGRAYITTGDPPKKLRFP